MTIKTIRQFHRWAGLVLGLQVVFWVAGGLIMSVLPIDQVRGNHLVDDHGRSPIALSSVPAWENLTANQSQSYSSISAFENGEFSYLVVEHQSVSEYLDSETGAVLSDLDEQTAIKLATRYLVDESDVVGAELSLFDMHETRGINQKVWRVEFDDSISTTLYLHPTTGHLIRVRSDLWRVFDFVWMLHIMDYDDRTNFNHPLLIVFALSALIFVLAGATLLIDMLRRQRLRKIKQRSAPV